MHNAKPSHLRSTSLCERCPVFRNNPGIRGVPLCGKFGNGPFFLARSRWSKFSPLPAVAAALLLSIPLVKNTRLEQHLFISLLASVLLRLCRCALSGPGTTWCGGLGVGHGIATSASRDGMNNHSRPCSRVSYGGTKPTNQQLCSSLACLGAQRCYGPQPSHMTTSSPRM